jgi:hypothetical protein
LILPTPNTGSGTSTLKKLKKKKSENN